MRFAHVKLIAKDWRRLERFYCEVLGCVAVDEARDLGPDVLDAPTGLQGARLQGRHLRLPGCGAEGPTLELFGYAQVRALEPVAANLRGFSHIAFAVDDVDATLSAVLAHGGSRLGEPTTRMIEGAGQIRFVYARDPEGNILELQRWQAEP